MNSRVIVLLLLGILCWREALAIDNGLALLPPMGWSTWCTDDIIECYDDFCNEDEIKAIGDAMVQNGMAALGYTYVNLDDCWAGPRDEYGNLTADSSRFPSGMKALADYLHAEGLKLGLYTCAGNFTCRGGRPGSWEHFVQDANTFAQWGIDEVKMDWCFHPALPPDQVYGMMRDALNHSGRAILYSICEWGEGEPWTWGNDVGNMWRVGPDHLPFYWLPGTKQGVVDVIENMAGKSNYSSPGGWNDPDFLMTGAITMTHTDSVTEFSFWSLFAAPLIVSTDIRDMSNKKDILLNEEVIAVNQDKLAKAGDRLAKWSNGGELWSKPLSDGSFAVILFNSNFWDSLTLTVTWQQVWNAPSGTQAAVRDLWAHQDLGIFTDSFNSTVQGHGVTMIRVTPQGKSTVNFN